MTNQVRMSRRSVLMMTAAMVGLMVVMRSGAALAEMDLNVINQVPLTLAAAQGDLKKVHDLLISGTSPNLTDVSGRPAIGWAALEGHTEIVNELLKAPRIMPDYKDRQGNTALILAAQRGHAETVDALLQAKVNVNIDNKDGMTALMLAAQSGYTRIVQSLVKAGADTTIQDRTGRTALDWAQENNRPGVVRVLQSSAAK